MSEAAPRTWILTGSPENFAATRDREFSLIGLKEKRRALALQIEAGDRIVFYLTRIKRFAASVIVTGELFEDRTPVWPGKPGAADPYPWRFETRPELVLDEADWVPAEDLAESSSTCASGRRSTGRSPSRARSAPSPTLTHGFSSTGCARPSACPHERGARRR